MDYAHAADVSVERDSALLEVRDLSIRYGDGDRAVQAVESVSFRLEKREIVSIVGPSGCGKSSLLRVIAHLQRPSSGQVRFNSSSWTPNVPDGLAMMFQSPVLLDWRSVVANIALPLEASGIRSRAARQMAREFLVPLGLDEFGGRRPYELSGGMQQRVALGRALVTSPSLLLMDEPFGALDALTREKMAELVLGIWRGRQLAVILVTHSISEAVLLSNRVIVMSSRPGRVIEDIEINLPQERSSATRELREFHEYEDRVRESLGHN